MPNLGLPELIVIFVIVVLVFGVGRLGEVGGALGKGIREFKKASTYDPSQDEELKKATQIEKPDEEKKAE